MKPTLDKYGIDFVAVGLHAKMAEDFLSKSGFKGQFVINEKKDVFAGVKMDGWTSMFYPSVIRNYRKSQAMNLGGIMDSTDGFQLGGLVVIDPPPNGDIIYQWDQPQMGVYPPVEEVLKEATSGMSPVVETNEKETKESETPTELASKKAVVSSVATEAVDAKSDDNK